MLPQGSSNLPEFRTGRPIRFGLALDGVYTASYVTIQAVVSCTTFSPLPFGGYFLLHFPWSRLHRMLSGILPYKARTFLTLVRPSVLLKDTLTLGKRFGKVKLYYYYIPSVRITKLFTVFFKVNRII